MNIYYISMYSNATSDSIARGKSSEYNHFAAVGTWVYRRPACIECGYYWQELIAPLQIEWSSAQRIAGDFSWDGPFGTICLVKDSVGHVLQMLGFECQLDAVEEALEFDENDISIHFKPTASYLWFRTTNIVDIDLDANIIRTESSCDACGDVRYTFKDSSIKVSKKTLGDSLLFRLRSNGPSLLFVTETGRRILMDAKFTNICFTEAGQVTD